MSSTVTFPRISGRQGQPIDLDTTIYQAGVPANPYAIYKVELYKTSPVSYNLMATIPIVSPTSTDYPSPVQQEVLVDTQGNTISEVPGKYHLITTIPSDWYAPDVYFDMWYFYPNDPCLGQSSCDLDDPVTRKQLLTCCHRFWVYPDEWFCTDALQTVRFGFEPLDQKFRQPENRPLEIGLIPLPLYDYNHNLVTPLIPFLQPTITISTTNCEVLYENAPMTIALRQGSYRSNPYVCRYMLDTNRFLIGTYKYRVTLTLPDGTSRTSDDFIFVVR